MDAAQARPLFIDRHQERTGAHERQHLRDVGAVPRLERALDEKRVVDDARERRGIGGLRVSHPDRGFGHRGGDLTRRGT
jgi:hypothetical protein